MPEVEALAQLGPRILVHEAASLMEPQWWAVQDCRMIVRCLRLLRLIGGPRAAAALASIKKLPDYSAFVTGEWMMASSELCDAALPWPFHVKDSVRADGTRVSDLRPIAGLLSLKSLRLACTLVSELRPIAELSYLRVLDVQRTNVVNLTPLAGLPALQSLTIFNTAIRDLRPLERIASLKTLHVTAQTLPKDEIERFSRCRPDVAVRYPG